MNKLLGFILILIMISIACSPEIEKEYIEVPNEIVLSTYIAQLYKDNIFAYNEKFKDKTLRVSGHVERIRFQDGKPLIELHMPSIKGGFDDTFYCHVEKEDSLLLVIRPNDLIEMVGKLDGYKKFELNNCKIIKHIR